MKKLFGLTISVAALLAAQSLNAAVVDPNNMSFTARQLLQIALQDDSRISYSGLDGQIGPKTIAAIKRWQQLEGETDVDPLDDTVVCALIRKGVRGHGSGTKLPSFCR